jgi:hypothetical protein
VRVIKGSRQRNTNAAKEDIHMILFCNAIDAACKAKGGAAAIYSCKSVSWAKDEFDGASLEEFSEP